MKAASHFLAGFLLVTSALIPGDGIAAGRVQAANAEEVPMTCTFSFKGTINGVEVDVTVSVSEVSKVECAIMKAAAKSAAKK